MRLAPIPCHRPRGVGGTCWGTGTAVALALKPIHPLIIFIGIYGILRFYNSFLLRKKAFLLYRSKNYVIIVLCSVVGNLAFFAAVKMIPLKTFLLSVKRPLLVYIYWSIVNRRISPVTL